MVDYKTESEAPKHSGRDTDTGGEGFRQAPSARRLFDESLAGLWLRRSAFTILTAVLLSFLLYAISALFRPRLRSTAVVYSAREIAAAERLRDTSFDAVNPPVIYREVDYGEGPDATWWPKGESPILAELVAEGELPPVEERVGPEPLVLEGVDGIGNYGGTWMRAATSPGDVGVIGWRLAGATLLRWSPMGNPVVPHIAKGWEVSKDQTEWTFHLRRGMRWSDGHPFTADDIVYSWNYQKWINPEGPQWMRPGGKRGDIVKVDDHTIRFVFSVSYSLLLERLAWHGGIAVPKHYLAKYHPEFGDDALIEATMKAKNIPTRRGLYDQMANLYNPEHPRLWPWIYRTYKANAPQFFVRNPYYFAVDPKGNQLPYVDRVMFEVKGLPLIGNSASGGALTMQTRHIRYENYSLLMSEREHGGYEVYHWYSGARSVWAIFPNLNRRVEPGVPETRWKARLLADKRFRQALSLAIDRRKIIDADYNGVGEPAQISPGRASSFFNERLHQAFVEYEPERASELLDELGLDRRDREGFRTFPDGTRMLWFLDLSSFFGAGPAQFVVDDWAEVGLRVIFRVRSRAFFGTYLRSGRMDLMVWSGESEFNPMVVPRSFVAVARSHGVQADRYALWYVHDGIFGKEMPPGVDAIEPPLGHPIRRGLEILEAAYRAPTREEQRDIFNEALEIAAENLWVINIATPPPQLAIVKNGFRNVPRNVIYGAAYYTPANGGIETFYFEKPGDSPAAVAQMKEELLNITPVPNAVGSQLARLIRLLVWGSIFAGLFLLGRRHPYIGKRLLILAPTLVIISVITFVIIQAPPGDFIQSKIIEAEMSGDKGSIDTVKQLRELFPLDEPIVVQYALWLGLKWFVSFDSKDTGLLQGNLGRSMETRKKVNEIVGDRILLTFFIALGTVLFTWAVALPIGIYSAVRQYSVADYILTMVGFIGMCVPNFLLALILMYLSKVYLGINITGLFSPDYAARPDWTWGKVGDLLKHIWLPVLVVGVSGTAGMIRVMRGNLLDELRKPYVMTGRAKGVRPLRLLMKYPVRMALNPFISGIGGIFPQLVSGSAIVAIVVNLPTVGPLMLSALMTEDMYLAGSMLMVLSLLGVFGTLVSDLLLMWLDPRIRMEGGSR